MGLCTEAVQAGVGKAWLLPGVEPASGRPLKMLQKIHTLGNNSRILRAITSSQIWEWPRFLDCIVRATRSRRKIGRWKREERERVPTYEMLPVDDAGT